MKSCTKGLSGYALKLSLLVASGMLLLFAVGCNSAPSITPEKFVQSFIQKHIPMIDMSVADFYVEEEQAGVIDKVKAVLKKSEDSAASVAQYDFSNVKVAVIDKREEYVNDEAIEFVKVAATGSYTKTMNGKAESLKENEIIILESIAGQWKVTEKINPWN